MAVADNNMKSGFEGFSKLSFKERLERLVRLGFLRAEEANSLSGFSAMDVSLAEHFIENAIGYFELPLGVIANMRIDGKDFAIPMAVEETSIIAACSKTAKWIRESGEIKTQVKGNEIIGQIQFAHLTQPQYWFEKISEARAQLIDDANNEVAANLVRRGGGVRGIRLRQIERPDSQGLMGVVHVLMDPCDAMGANMMNQVCEYLKAPLEKISQEKVTMCILSNLVDSRLTRAEVRLSGVEPELGEKIQEASYFAEWDPYRAATHNKGVMNGIDPLLIATGNDWRAVEAGVHAFAARDGQYRAVTTWRYQKGELFGVFEAPLVVGVVGGVTQLHPRAKMSLNMLGHPSADELSRICGAVGLVQNLGALKALTTVGIIEGHMKLHIRNLSLGAGADEKEMPLLQKKLEKILSLRKRISLSQAVDALREMRTQKTETLS